MPRLEFLADCVPINCTQYYDNKIMSCLVLRSFLFSTPYFLCLKFAGNLVALKPRFHAYVISEYKTDKGSYRDHYYINCCIGRFDNVIKHLVHAPAVHLSRYCTWEVWRALKRLELVLV